MTSNVSEPEIGVLQRAIDTIEGLGFIFPPHLTLRRYLTILVEHGLVSEATAQGFLEAHDEATFAARKTDHSSGAAIARMLVSEVSQSTASSPAAVSAIKQALTTTPTPEDRQPPAELAGEPEIGGAKATNFVAPAEPLPHDPDIPRITGAETRGTALSPLHFRAGRRTRWTLALVMSVMWTGAAVAVGYLANEHISRSLHYLTAHVLNLPISMGSGDHHLESARRVAADHPNSIGAWRNYADQALRRDQFAQGAVALRRLISLQPDNARTLNELAWLLCTADEPTVRDPIQALELAEKAHSLDPSPAITDTLAEAVFQNGDPQRAIDLEEDALARLTTGQDHYLRQLEKFRATLE